MKLLWLLPVLLLPSGCAISNHGVFPRLVWYWSADAQEQRREDAASKAAGKAWQESQRTNAPAKPTSTFKPNEDLVAKVQKRDGTNFLGVYMGMIAELDGSTSVYRLYTKEDGTPDFSRDGHMVPNMKPEGVMMFSATSGQLLKWISYQDFQDIFVLKIKPEYP